MVSVPVTSEKPNTFADAERYFCTDYLDSDLKARSILGGVTALIAQGCKFSLQLVSVAVLARLLTPEDYGLFSIAIAIAVFVNLFKDLGLPLATVQSAEINHRQVSTLFWINVALGCVLAVVTVAAAPLVGWVYREPRLVGVIGVMAGAYIVNGLVSQPQALLRRQMRFVVLAVIDVASMALGVAIAIIAAWFKAGYWALVCMQWVMIGANAVGVWAASRWRPGLPDRLSDIRPMLGFGGHVTGTSLFSYMARNLDNLLIGWYWGMRDLGLYDKAYQLLLLPLLQISMPISGIAIPVLSRLQSDPRRYREYFSKIILLSAALGMSLTLFLFVTADKAIVLILGSQWMLSVPIFRALAPAAFLDTFLVSINWVLMSLGQTRRMFRWSVVASIIAVVGFLAGLAWGAVGVAIAFSVSRAITFLPMLIYCCRESPLHWLDVIRVVLRPAGAAIGAALSLAIVVQWFSFRGSLFVDLIADAVMYGLFFLLIWLALPGGRQTLAEIVSVIPRREKIPGVVNSA